MKQRIIIPINNSKICTQVYHDTILRKMVATESGLITNQERAI